MVILILMKITFMPLGIPVVRYAIRKKPFARSLSGKDRHATLRCTWIDIYVSLLSRGIIFVVGDLNRKQMNNIMGLLLSPFMSKFQPEPRTRADLKKLHSDKLKGKVRMPFLSLYINSPGGRVSLAFGVFDLSQHLYFHQRLRVRSIVSGFACSSACFLAACAPQKTSRYVQRYGCCLMHEPASWWRGGSTVLEGQMSRLRFLRRQLVRYYSDATLQPEHIISKDITRDFYMGSVASIEYGIIDSIVAVRRKQADTLANSWLKVPQTTWDAYNEFIVDSYKETERKFREIEKEIPEKNGQKVS
jgi:ATP-dependent Clp endopeptidase proteolytic subunit ClpP